jgi:hypothetical protein
MLIRPMPAPTEHRQGANYVRQQTDIGSISGEAMRAKRQAKDVVSPGKGYGIPSL